MEEQIKQLCNYTKILEETIHIILDNQKKYYFEIEKLKREQSLSNNTVLKENLDSFNELVTSSLENGLFKQEKTEVRKNKLGQTVYIVTRILNEKKFIHTIYTENGENIESEEFTNCKKNEFLKLWESEKN